MKRKYKLCSICGCTNLHYAKGLCRSHWKKSRFRYKTTFALTKREKSEYKELPKFSLPSMNLDIDELNVLLNNTPLSLRERKILFFRFGLMDGMPHDLRQAGKLFGITRERVRQIESRIFRKLRYTNSKIKCRIS